MPVSVESIERATLAAVPPRAVVELDGWLLALDDGTVGRARSAAPLHHDEPDASLIPRIEAVYRSRGLPPAFRLPLALPGSAPFIARLESAGYRRRQPTRVMLAATLGLVGPPSADVRLDETAGDDWAALYLGEGFDPVDGASRVSLLRRSSRSLFASLRTADGTVAAVGCACFAEGVVGIHGMRTRPRFRGQGFARRIIGAVATAARTRGLDHAFLQVDESNAALALYQRIGFEPRWTYAYWEAGDVDPQATPVPPSPTRA